MATFDDYTPDSNPDLINPERGMYSAATPNFGVADEPTEDDPTDKRNYHTIVPQWLWLRPWCEKDLVWNGYLDNQTNPVLNEYAKTLEDARSGGYKILFRPRYDRTDKKDDPDYDPKDVYGPSDCTFDGGSAKVFHAESKERQKSHITAIANMLASYRDVIAYIQAGYLGRWGEWNWDPPRYTSDNAPLLADIAFREEIIDWVIDEYDRVGIMQHVELRRPVFAKEVVKRNSSAKVGLHNDCFMTTNSDLGTYSNFDDCDPSTNPDCPNFATSEQAKAWAVDWTEHSSFGGETCPLEPTGSERWRSCTNMTGATSEPAEPASLHMNYLNRDYAVFPDPAADDGTSSAVEVWQKGGCYDEIRRRLGYRFEVTRVEYPETVSAGETFSVAVDVKNTGWARLHKPRIAKLVLRNGAPPDPDKEVHDLDGGKVETWGPWEPGDDPNQLSITEQAPSTPGKYSVRLWIPDPDLQDNDPDEVLEVQEDIPKATINYAVKLATKRNDANGDSVNVFDQTTGENDLGVEIEVQ
jgi:hypothetical protein